MEFRPFRAGVLIRAAVIITGSSPKEQERIEGYKDSKE
jgi:hypothetical protein